jgi:hypothetical protein
MPTQSKFRNYSATLDHMGRFMREMIKKTATLILIMIAAKARFPFIIYMSTRRQTKAPARPAGHRPTGRSTLVTLPPLCSVGECLRRQAAVHGSLDLRIICSSSRLSRKSILPSKFTNH